MKALFCSLLLALPLSGQDGLPPSVDVSPEPWGPEQLRGKLGNVGVENDLGTLPLNSESSGGGSGGGTQGGTGGATEDPTRPGAKSKNVQPCTVGTNGGTDVANQCSSSGSVTIEPDGSVNCPEGTTAIVQGVGSSDSVNIAGNCNVAAAVKGSKVTVTGWNTHISITNTAFSKVTLVDLPGYQGTVAVQPGTTWNHWTGPKPPGI